MALIFWRRRRRYRYCHVHRCIRLAGHVGAHCDDIGRSRPQLDVTQGRHPVTGRWLAYDCEVDCLTACAGLCGDLVPLDEDRHRWHPVAVTDAVPRSSNVRPQR